MTVQLVNAGGALGNTTQISSGTPKLDAMVCPDCDCDNDITLGEIEERKRQQAKDAAWNEVCGWVK